MPLICCTKKLQTEMGLKANDLADLNTDFANSDLLGNWHANLIKIGRYKCVLFTNDKTLFNFIVTGVKKAQLNQLDKLFKHHLQCVLAAEGMTSAQCEQILHEYPTIAFAKTYSRRVIGAMNDLAFHYTMHIQDEGGVNHCLLPPIISKLNRMPMKGLGYNYPFNALFSLYKLEAPKASGANIV